MEQQVPTGLLRKTSTSRILLHSTTELNSTLLVSICKVCRPKLTTNGVTLQIPDTVHDWAVYEIQQHQRISLTHNDKLALY